MKITIITVTFRNDDELRLTLESLRKLECKPYEVLVIDGAVSPTAKAIALNYADSLNIRYYGEFDSGIYDGMNKGLAKATGDFIHYLNSGDYISGEPYSRWQPGELLPVKLIDRNLNFLGYAKRNLWRTSYNHQGLLFPNPHKNYDISYAIAADYLLMREIYPDGFSDFIVNTDGFVAFNTAGISSKNRVRRDQEIARIIRVKDGDLAFLLFHIFSWCKRLLPSETIRRYYVRLSAIGSRF